MRKSSMPACLRATAMPSPPNPAPTTTTRYAEPSGTGPPRALRGPGQDAARVPDLSGTRHGQDSGNHLGRPGPGSASACVRPAHRGAALCAAAGHLLNWGFHTSETIWRLRLRLGRNGANSPNLRVAAFEIGRAHV